MDKKEIISFLTQHKKRFEQEYSITEIGLFGSFAKDEAHYASDIDIVVQMHDKNYFKLIEFENYIKSQFGRKVDVGFLEPMKSYIKESISKDIIYV